MDHSQLERVEGLNLALRLITTDDAAYVHALRTDPTYNEHLSEVRGGVNDQRRWIEAYKNREAQGLEYYYVIERLDGERCGVVRLYDIDQDSFTWGSWILDQNKPPKAALESAVLSFGVGFQVLAKSIAHIDVRIGNEKATAFYRRLGMSEVRSDERNLYFTYSRLRFLADLEHHTEIVTAAADVPARSASPTGCREIQEAPR